MLHQNSTCIAHGRPDNCKCRGAVASSAAGTIARIQTCWRLSLWALPWLACGNGASACTFGISASWASTSGSYRLSLPCNKASSSKARKLDRCTRAGFVHNLWGGGGPVRAGGWGGGVGGVSGLRRRQPRESQANCGCTQQPLLCVKWQQTCSTDPALRGTARTVCQLCQCPSAPLTFSHRIKM